MLLIGFVIFCLLIMADEKKDNRKKTVRTRKSRKSGGTWWESLNEGDRAWLYDHYK